MPTSAVPSLLVAGDLVLDRYRVLERNRRWRAQPGVPRRGHPAGTAGVCASRSSRGWAASQASAARPMSTSCKRRSRFLA